MRKRINCVIKQQLRRCPYRKLIKIEHEISYLKKARQYLKKQYEALINEVEQMSSLNFNNKKRNYLDGFHWINNEEDIEKFHNLQFFNQGTKESIAGCPFNNQDCALQLLARSSMKYFLREKLVVEVEKYNAILKMYDSIYYYHRKVEHSSILFIRSSIEKHLVKAFYYPVEASTINGQYTIMFFEKKLYEKECYRYTLHFKIESDSSPLAKTCVLNLGERPILIELCELLCWIEEGIPFKLKSFYELLRTIKRTQSMTISLYGKLDNLSIKEKKACITYFQKQGFRILGEFKEEGYFEKESLIYCLIEQDK